MHSQKKKRIEIQQCNEAIVYCACIGIKCGENGKKIAWWKSRKKEKNGEIRTATKKKNTCQYVERTHHLNANGKCANILLPSHKHKILESQASNSSILIADASRSLKLNLWFYPLNWSEKSINITISL